MKANSGTAISAPTIPPTMMPIAIDDQHGQRMQLHRPSQKERLQHMALDLHHQDDAAKHDQRLDPAKRDKGDEHGNETRDQRPDDRDEGADEDQRRQCGSHRDTQDQRHDEHTDAVEQRDQNCCPHVRR